MEFVMDNICTLEYQIVGVFGKKERVPKTEKWVREIETVEDARKIYFEYQEKYRKELWRMQMKTSDVVLKDGRRGYFDGAGNVYEYKEGAPKFNVGRKLLKD